MTVVAQQNPGKSNNYIIAIVRRIGCYANCIFKIYLDTIAHWAKVIDYNYRHWNIVKEKAI
jgi:hypothetical protein